MPRKKIGRSVLKQKRRYGGPRYGYEKEKYDAYDEIRKYYPVRKFIIERTWGGGKGAADYKVFERLSNGSKGHCIAVIQVKASPYIEGARYTKYDITRLRMSASHHRPKCDAYLLLLERGKPTWIDAFTLREI